MDNEKLYSEFSNKFNNLSQQMQKIEQSLLNLENNQNNQTNTILQQPPSNKLIIESYTSEFANKLYNKINNQFNFYRINLQIRQPTDEGIGGGEIGILKIQEEFVKFIVLKIMADDIDNDMESSSKLIPSPIIYDYWETLVLNTEKYIEFINFLGINIKTRELYEKYFPNFIKSELNNQRNTSLSNLTTNQHYYNNATWPHYYLISTDELLELQPHLQIIPNPDEHINIRVTGANGADIHFKIKKTTPLEKLMSAYCQRNHVQKENIRFIYKGARINYTDNAFSLGMEDNDTIIAILHQSAC